MKPTTSESLLTLGTGTHTHTHRGTHAHMHPAADKVRGLLPSSSSHELGIRDLPVGTPGCPLHACAIPPTPQLHNQETGAFEGKGTCQHTHLEVPSYCRIRYNHVFSPTQMTDTTGTDTAESKTLGGWGHTYTHHPGCCPLLCFLATFQISPLLSLSPASPGLRTGHPFSCLCPSPASSPRPSRLH